MIARVIKKPGPRHSQIMVCVFLLCSVPKCTPEVTDCALKHFISFTFPFYLVCFLVSVIPFPQYGASNFLSFEIRWCSQWKWSYSSLHKLLLNVFTFSSTLSLKCYGTSSYMLRSGLLRRNSDNDSPLPECISMVCICAYVFLWDITCTLPEKNIPKIKLTCKACIMSTSFLFLFCFLRQFNLCQWRPLPRWLTILDFQFRLYLWTLNPYLFSGKSFFSW